MNEQKKTKGAKWFGIPNLVPYMRPYGKLIFWMVLMAFYGSAMDAVIPLFQQYAIDHYIADSTLAGLGWFIGAYVVVILTQTASNYISAFGACKLELSVGRDLKRESFNHLQTLSFSYFNQNSVGYVHARVMSDTDRIASTLAWSMAEGVWHSAYLVCAIVMMLILNWKMALCVLVIVPIVAISSMYFQKKLVFFHRQVREKNSRITGAFNEGITGATTTKTLVVEDKMEKEFDELTADMKKVSAMHFRAIFISTTTLAASLALALVLWRGGIVTREGVMLIGTLTVFMNYAQGMMEPIQWLVQALSSLVNVQVNVERFTTLMETKSDVQDTPEVVEKYGDTFSPKKENWEELHGDIEFKDVTFRYPDGDENILEHFNLKVPQGTNVAIVGETGAGKSTLVNLVCRFYEPTEGQVLIDGQDLFAMGEEARTIFRRRNCSSTDGTPGNAASSGSTATSAMCSRRRTSSLARCSKTSATAARTRPWGRSKRRSEPSLPKGSLRDCRTAIRATSARAATASRPARSSFCPSPARCLPIRASLCSTRRRPPSIRSRSGSSRTPSRRSWTGARRL